MQRVKIDETELAYEVSGSGEAVVCIHGAFIADTFGPLLAELSQAGRYRLIHYHRRGYAGSSRSAGPVSIAMQAADCSTLLRHLDVERAHVVGHSYGGTIALQLALDNPDVACSLALLEPALMVEASAQGYRESLLKAIERYRAAGASVAVDEFLQARWTGYRAQLDRMLPGAFAQAVADAGTAFNFEISRVTGLALRRDRRAAHPPAGLERARRRERSAGAALRRNAPAAAGVAAARRRVRAARRDALCAAGKPARPGGCAGDVLGTLSAACRLRGTHDGERYRIVRRLPDRHRVHWFPVDRMTWASPLNSS